MGITSHQPIPANLWVSHLRRMPYLEAQDLQRRLAALRIEGRIDDILLILQHPATVTLGRFGKPDNLLVPREELRRQKIEFCRTDRGGDITFHCPGQLVVYPVM